MKKFPFKVLTLATLATVITATTGNTIHAFAQETTAQEQKVGNYALGPEGLKKALAETGSHILVMDLYAKTMIKQPNVNLSNIDLGSEGGELLKNIHLNQELSRINANYWLDTAKPQIQKTARNIVNYDEQFQNYYDTLVETVQKKDKAGLKEGINDLITTINTNSKEVTDVIKMLQDFKGKLYQNSTDFKNNVGGPDGKGGLTAILAGQQATIPQLQAEIEQLRSTQKKHFDDVLAWSIGGIIVGVARDNLGKLEPLLAELRQTVDYKVTLNRVVGVAYSNINEMHKALDDAINALTYMSTQWHDLDSQYSGVLGHIENAAQKADQNKFKFLKPNLNAAKDSWKTLRTDAVTLKEGIKELKVETVTPQK